VKNTTKIFKDKLQQEKVGLLLTEIWGKCSTDQGMRPAD